jgi:hypothetical protein
MTIASDLLQRHIETLVDDNAQWRALIADDILWELAYAPSIGHPAQLSGREEAVRHAIWFVGAVENFRFFELKVYTLADPERASPKSRGRGSSSLRDVCIARTMCYSCVLQAARSRSYENISILCVRLGHWTRRSSVSNPEDNRRAKAFVGPWPDPHLETTLRLDREVSNA